MATAVNPEYLAPPSGGGATAWPTCVTQAVHDEAATACARLSTELRGFGLSDPYVGDPCRAAALPVCKRKLLPSLPDFMRREKSPNTPAGEDDGAGALVVVGLLGLIVAGGVGYYVYKRGKKS
jgi:hypothetical protein